MELYSKSGLKKGLLQRPGHAVCIEKSERGGLRGSRNAPRVSSLMFACPVSRTSIEAEGFSDMRVAITRPVVFAREPKLVHRAGRRRIYSSAHYKVYVSDSQ